MEFFELFHYAFFRNAFLAAFIMAISCGLIGTYIVSRRMVFISGGITHASFGGVGLGYFLGLPPLGGAAIFSVLAAIASEHLTHKHRVRNDSVIAMMWSLGMAMGIIFVYLTPGYAPNLMSYLFGSILTVSPTDLILMAILALVNLGFFLRFFSSILSLSFDEQFARTRGIPVMLFNYALITLSALTIVLSIRVSGIILVLSLLTIPQNTANLFTTRFGGIMALSVIIGFLGSMLGLLLSYYLEIPSGACIIFTLVLIYLAARLIKVVNFKH